MTGRLFPKPICAKERNGPPNASQGQSMVKLRNSHAVCTLQVHPPTSPVLPFLLAQNLSPKDIAGSDITSYASITYNQLMPHDINQGLKQSNEL